jgi:ribosomal protein S18 acetylase RimI-like enzyme
MAQIDFRLLKACDLDDYRTLRLECLTNYPDYFGDSYEEEVSATNKFYKTLRTNENNSFLYGAFSENRLIGISGFTQDGRMKTRHRGDLVQVYVNPSFSGKGIGKTLIKLTVEKAFENALIDQIHLSVVSTNKNAISLYEKFGFVQFSILENYFKKGNTSWSQAFMLLTRKGYMANH